MKSILEKIACLKKSFLEYLGKVVVPSPEAVYPCWCCGTLTYLAEMNCPCCGAQL